MSATFANRPRRGSPTPGRGPATIERFIAHCHRRKYPARTDEIPPRRPGWHPVPIISGSVSIIASEEDGRELVLGYIGPNLSAMGLFVETEQRGAPAHPHRLANWRRSATTARSCC